MSNGVQSNEETITLPPESTEIGGTVFMAKIPVLDENGKMIMENGKPKIGGGMYSYHNRHLFEFVKLANGSKTFVHSSILQYFDIVKDNE